MRAAAGRAATLALACALLSGCGAILNGTTQGIRVESSPSGARVETAPYSGVYSTPTVITLDRKDRYTLTFSSPGYAPATVNIASYLSTGTLVADVLLTGLVGVLVDAISGGWCGLSPESATVTLVKLQGPGSIDVHLSNASGGTLGISSDAPGVTVQVATAPVLLSGFAPPTPLPPRIGGFRLVATLAIDATGAVSAIQFNHLGNDAYDRALEDALHNLRFAPSKLQNGAAVAGSYTLQFLF